MSLSIVGSGVTRHVLLVGRVAIKVPRLNYGWRKFIEGLLANMNERECWKAMVACGREPRPPHAGENEKVFRWHHDRMRRGFRDYARVLWCCPGGWLIVMERAERLCTASEMPERLDHFPDSKPDNVGWIRGRWRVIDYGSP